MEIIGYIAGTLTLIGFLPQTIKAIRTRRTHDLALTTFLMLAISATLWTVYGLYYHQPAIWLTNMVVLICSVIITALKLREVA